MGQNKILVSFLVGAALGGIAAILIAPDKGKNTRANILDSSTDFLARFKASYNNAIDNVTLALDSVVEETEEDYDPIISLEEDIIATDGTNQL